MIIPPAGQRVHRDDEGHCARQLPRARASTRWRSSAAHSSLGRADFRNLEALLVAALMYWGLTTIFQYFQLRLERRLSKGYVRGTARVAVAGSASSATSERNGGLPRTGRGRVERPVEVLRRARGAEGRRPRGRSHGQVVVVFGRSGSGKSTLLRCINFLEEPSEGTIEVAGIRVAGGGHRTRAKRERIRQLRIRTGMVFQDFNLVPAPHGARERHRRPRDRARQVCARRRADGTRAPARWLGSRRRPTSTRFSSPADSSSAIAIARALAMNPKVMLFDEPTSALDPELIGEVLAVMRAPGHRAAHDHARGHPRDGLRA